MSASSKQSRAGELGPGELARRIKQARLRIGLSQRDLATKLGITPGAVGQWELGSVMPSGGRLGALAKALGVRADWLLEKKPETGDQPGASAAEDLSLLEEARRLGVDLRQVVAEARERRWLEENREAFNDANVFLERFGLWSDGRRLF